LFDVTTNTRPGSEDDLLASALLALRFHRLLLGDGLGALEPFSAFLATV